MNKLIAKFLIITSFFTTGLFASDLLMDHSLPGESSDREILEAIYDRTAPYLQEGSEPQLTLDQQSYLSSVTTQIQTVLGSQDNDRYLINVRTLEMLLDTSDSSKIFAIPGLAFDEEISPFFIRKSSAIAHAGRRMRDLYLPGFRH